MNRRPLVDPMEHAWQHCNLCVPLPPILVQRAAPSGLALSLYSSHARLVAERSAPQRTRREHFLTVATLPRISSLMGE
jgi:hypothetical protein